MAQKFNGTHKLKVFLQNATMIIIYENIYFQNILEYVSNIFDRIYSVFSKIYFDIFLKRNFGN